MSSLIETLEYTKRHIIESLNRRHDGSISDDSISFSSRIPPPKKLASYALIPGAIVLAVVMFAIVTRGHFAILREAHDICWTHGRGTMAKLRVVKSVVLLLLVVIAILLESLAAIDYLNGESVDYMPLKAVIGNGLLMVK